jgi:CheY-like chemotaxis protein
MKEFSSKNIDPDRINRFHRFQDLMRNRVRHILLVSSMYDSYILEEDGRLDEKLISEYIDLNLTHSPGITRVSRGQEALRLAKDTSRFNLIVTTVRLGDMHALEFGRKLRKLGISTPLVLLSFDHRELSELKAEHDLAIFDKVFTWQGDFRILLAIVKCIEDRMNVAFDTRLVGVQSIIIIEDSVRFYSSYLPLFYTELLSQSQHVLSEAMNRSHRLLRMRARPKLLLCHTYEEAWHDYETYHDYILGIVSDIKFPRRGRQDPEAGLEFARAVREAHPDVPILLQSNNEKFADSAHGIGASFLLKHSPLLLHELSEFMKSHFSFGEFVFKLPDGTAIGTADNLRTLEARLESVPDESILYHAERNHFSNWLKARTEFELAYKLRPRKVTDYATVDDLRKYLINAVRSFRYQTRRGQVVDFEPESFDPAGGFARIGGGSLGGKGRGLGFVNNLIILSGLRDHFDDVVIDIPTSVVIGTDQFDEFLNRNDLRDFAINCQDDREIERRFLQAKFSNEMIDTLTQLVEKMDYPLAVRSSGLLEDSRYQPFAGVYRTFMLPNNSEKTYVRVQKLLHAIKRVYASTFLHSAKVYMKATAYRLEEEKMAVIIQRLVGSPHSDRFYPDVSGVVQSHNFYPVAPMKPSDGVASVALGLGSIVMEGGTSIRFCPRYPRHLLQFSSVDDALEYTQKEFLALKMSGEGEGIDYFEEAQINRYPLSVAETDNALWAVGSTYSPENNAVYDGLSRDGVRMVSFAPILKHNVFPLARILELILEVGRKGMNSPVELEFAAHLSTPKGKPREFAVLQMRPMVISHELEELNIEEGNREDLICHSTKVLGNGILKDIRDVIVVDISKFDRSKSRNIAGEVAQFNAELMAGDIPYPFRTC